MRTPEAPSTVRENAERAVDAVQDEADTYRNGEDRPLGDVTESYDGVADDGILASGHDWRFRTDETSESKNAPTFL